MTTGTTTNSRQAAALPLLATVGLIIVGDEILSGRRRDGHLDHAIGFFGPRGVEVARVRLVGDHRQRLADCLEESRRDGFPTVCFGGIGATPDDHTRQAAALAWGVALVEHPEAAHILETRYGPEARPHRIRMAELPAGCGLIPNPFNGIPGFYLDHHWFLPGFPEMAWPMMQWIIRSHYRVSGAAAHVRSLVLPDGREGEMVVFLERLEREFTAIKTFSLPCLGPRAALELGVKGDNADVVDNAFRCLEGWLAVKG